MHALALPRPPRGLAAALAALSLAACGGGGDSAPPALAGTVSPAAPAIWDNQPIKFIFNASMNTSASPGIGGTLAGDAPLATWSRTAVADDTLVLAPATAWTTGPQTVTVTSSDAAGRTLAAPLQASYEVKAYAPCGPSAGACNSATDCDFTVTQLADWTQGCFISSGLNGPRASACVQANGVTAACADCTTAMASCGFQNCAAPCAADPASAACTGCVSTNCAAAFVTCAGRTPPI